VVFLPDRLLFSVAQLVLLLVLQLVWVLQHMSITKKLSPKGQ
ncbi:hypothetical protein, partial [Neisseria meningitidis serogroup B]